MHGFPDTYVIIDTETTGMRPPFSRIIDIGIIRVEQGKIVDRFETLINPGISIPSFIRRFTDITDEDLQDAPTFEEVALRIEAIMKGAVFVAHNAPFDYAFIKSEFRRLDMHFSAETLCSVRLSRTLFPKERSHSLESIINRYRIPVMARHRAMPDAQAVWDFFRHIDRTLDTHAIERAVDVALQGKKYIKKVRKRPAPTVYVTDDADAMRDEGVIY